MCNSASFSRTFWVINWIAHGAWPALETRRDGAHGLGAAAKMVEF